MRWIKSDLWKAGIALTGLVFILVIIVWVPISAAAADVRASGLATSVTGSVQATPTIDPTIVAATAKEQLRKLELDNDRSFNAWFWNSGAALLSSLALVLGGVVAVFKYFSDRDAEREKRDEEQQRWLKNQEAEREKQAEERFQKVVEGLGSERMEAKVGAAITLRTFLQPGYERFYRQAFDLAVAYLRLRKAEASAPGQLSSPAQVLIVPKGDLRQEQQPPPTASILLDSLSQALITVFKESFPLARDELKKELEKTNAQFHPQLLDAADVRLDYAYLRAADLVEAWLHRASLREANIRWARLDGAQLRRAQLQGADLNLVQLQGAKLYGAQLQGADLRESQLQGADLREAGLERAHFGGAHLEGADLRGTQLKEANPEAADSLKNTKMNNVFGLTPEQRERCIQKGAIFADVQQAPTSATNSSSSSPPAQNNDIHVPSAPPAQVNTPPADANGSSPTSSKPGSAS